MNDWVNLGLGAVAGGVFSELLELAIKEAKAVKAFKPLSKDLVSTLERLLPLTQEIDSMQNELNLEVSELKKLRETIEIALIAIREFPSVNLYERSKYARKIVKINDDLLKFCDLDLQYRNLLKPGGLTGNLKESIDILNKRMDGLSVQSPVMRNICSVPKLHKVLVGMDWPLIEVKKKLLDDSVVRLLVCAPPGCGKTSLVMQLCHDPEIKGKFNQIFFNVVTSTPKFKVIVQDLLQHNGHKPVTFENDLQASVVLRQLLEKLQENGPILMVLDDVWRGAESFLQNFPTNIRNFKILVTSRSDFPSFGFSYHLRPLKDEDARALLIQWASRPSNVSQAEYEDLLQKILKRCKGFPIVIEVVGISLKDRPLSTWKGQVESWSGGGKILDNVEVLERLKPSFNTLEPNLKECFLDMGLFLEDQKIRASIIIDIWVELYGERSESCMKYLEDLASQNLLKLVPLRINEHEEEFLVTQHDILRELAISERENSKRKRLNLEIREDTFPEWCLNPVELINAALLSISTDDLFSSNWFEMDCPNVEALVLNLASSDYALPSFIARMKKLQVLTVTNHRFYLARLRNFSCLSSLPNLKRIRLEKVSINLMEIPQLQLQSLHKVSLYMCSLGVDIENAIVFKPLPRLQEIDIDFCYDLEELPSWVSEIVSLKTLSITNCNKFSKLPEAIGNLSKLEKLRLSSCINLSELPESTERLNNLEFLDLSHCLELRKLPQGIGKLQKLKTISMKKCSRCELPDSVRYLENLEVKCDEETGFLWERLKPKMRKLTVLYEETEETLLYTF